MTFMHPVLHNNCSPQIPFLRMRMAQATFLFLTLALFNLHLAQATTCQGDDCPTGDYYLLESKTIAYNYNQFDENLPFVVCIAYSFPIAGLVITGGAGATTSVETFPAEADCLIPPFPGKGNLSSRDYQHFIHSPPKGERATPSLSQPKEANLWLVAAGTPRLLASLGGMGKRTGKNSTH